MHSKSYLDDAKANKADEFYTQLDDIAKELCYYRNKFKGKVVLCNCDNPEFSNFYVYFSTNFLRLKLKELICTHYANGEPSYALHLTKDKKWKQPLKGDGDFRSAECLNLLRQSDIIVTNPPFSLFDKFISLLVQEKKQYLVMGPLSALSHKTIALLILHNKMQLGKSIHSGGRYFRIASDYPLTTKTYKVDDKGFKYTTVCIRWYTNMLTEKDYPAFMNLTYSIKTFAYNRYDNLKGAIDVNKTETIPYDFKGIMGVPISFIDKYNPKQFELVGFRKGQDGKDLKVKGKGVFARYLIRKR